jgi:hypothetical protein
MLDVKSLVIMPFVNVHLDILGIPSLDVQQYQWNLSLHQSLLIHVRHHLVVHTQIVQCEMEM